jgi:hypothetical protein
MNNFKEIQNDSPTSDVYYKQALWNELQDDVIHTINNTISYIEKNLKQRIEESLFCHVFSTHKSDVNNFDDFFNVVVNEEKKLRLQSGEHALPHKLYVFNKQNKTIYEIVVQKLENDVFSMREKIKILLSKYDADYYVTVAEAWRSKNDQIEERISKNYRRGDIIKLPSDEKVEALIFYGKTKNTTNRVTADKSEIYEMIRERPDDVRSRIVELRKDNHNHPLDMEMQHPELI